MKFARNLAVLACLFTVGCGAKPVTDSGADPDMVVMEGAPPDSLGHPEHGPNGGELIELGKEAFHLEMLHDDQSVTLDVLNGAASEMVAIDAAELSVSLKHDDEVKTFALPASNSTDGKASSFTITSTEMAGWMKEGAEGAVTLQIDGKSYTGKISHDHGHEGHDHEGHDHD